MISEKQLEANRRNALRSTGPGTAEGRERSSRNNLRHGLTGQITVMPGEDREAHDSFVNALVDSLNPETPMERQIAQSVAEDSWRLNRACAIDTNIYAACRDDERNPVRMALADARTFLDHANKFQLLTIYEQRINRNLQRNLKQLRELQAERKEERRRELEEARLLRQQTSSVASPASINSGNSSGVNKNGFVFSTGEIRHAIVPNHRAETQKQAPADPPLLATASLAA